VASPIYFLTKYCLIKSTEGGFIPFKLYPYQRKLVWDLLTHNLVVILKNRQIGCTWVIAGYALWKAIFHKAQNVIIISKGEAEATEVLDYCRFMCSHLPPFLQPTMGKDRAGLIEFTTLGSKIRALPATSVAGIGFGGASLVVMDEFDFHPNAESNYVEVKPMIDAGGSRQLVLLSAPDRTKLTSPFKNLWNKARKGLNNFYPIFLPFGVVPYHTEEWYERMKKDYTARDLETRYFKTEEEALSVTSAGRFFDVDKLTQMMSRTLTPLEKYDKIDIRGGVIRIFKPPVPTGSYVLFTDPSSGSEDPFHLVVCELSTKEEVANAHGWYSADEVALVHDTMVRHYNNAKSSYYRTGYSGARFQSALENLHTPNQMYSRGVDGKEQEGKYGYWESTQLRSQLLGTLREGIFQMEYVIHDIYTLEEFNTMIWSETENKLHEKVPIVPDKGHDDTITAWAGVVDLIKRNPKPTFKISSYSLH
jgi:hypothetical protein